MDAIRVDHISKLYRLGIGRARVQEMLPPPLDRAARKLAPRWWERDTFRALNDVSLDVPAGSAIGLIGHNGAGKTTLLKCIAAVTEPTEGSVVVSGKIAALIDVLAGFMPDLTGRENAFLLGSLYGLGRRAMAQRIDRIFRFAETPEGAIDTPLKRYSAGMAARLSFATVTALDIDILLVDEILAVGDASFQRKCITWLDEFRSGGGTLLFVSHNMGLVRSMTSRAVWLDHGRLVEDGPTPEVLSRYARATEHRDTMGAGANKRGDAGKLMQTRGLYRWGAGGARLAEVHVDEPDGDGAGVDISITFEAEGIDSAVFFVGFVDENGREIGCAASTAVPVVSGKGAVSCSIRPLPLRAGIYFPLVAILSPDGLVRDRWRLDRAVVVDRPEEIGTAEDFGPIHIDASWSGVNGHARPERHR